MRLNIIFNAQKKITYAGWFIYVFWVPCDQSVISINYSFHMNEWIEAQFKVLRNILSCLIIKFLVHLWYATQWTRFSFFFFFFVLWIDIQKRTKTDWDLAPAKMKNHYCIGQMNITYFFVLQYSISANTTQLIVFPLILLRWEINCIIIWAN